MSMRRLGVYVSPLIVLFVTTSVLSQPSAPAPVVFAPDVRLSDQPFSRGVIEREPSIAVNPTDPLNLVVGFKDHYPKPPDFACRIGFTTDGGTTWNLGGTPPSSFTDHACGDPALAADADGNFFYAYLDSQLRQGSIIVDTNLAVARSTDGGRTFPAFSTAVEGDPSRFVLLDKPYIAVDAFQLSKFKGNIYLSYGGDFSNLSYRIDVVVSSDGGLTWSTPVVVSDEASLATSEVIIGSLPVVAPDGAVYVFYVDGFDPVGPSRIMFAKSKDGGRSWSRPAAAASGLPNAVDFVVKNGNPQFGTQPDVGAIVNSFPTAAATPDGTIYVAWVDLSGGTCLDLGGFRASCIDTDVRLSQSSDGGRSWSVPVKVSDDTGQTDQMYPWIATHPNGLLSLMWMDKRLDPENVDYDVFYTNTPDGRTFLPNVRVSSETSRVGSVGLYGDYNGLAATADAVFPVWTDLREQNNLDVYVARGTLVH